MDAAQKIKHMVTHILNQLSKHRTRSHPSTSTPPLFIGVQGPQGSGKSYLTSHLHQTLTSPPHSLSVVVLSIDDLYLSHIQLTALARSNPQNALLRGRGQPGTHDVPLGTLTLNQLKRINDVKSEDPATSTGEVRLPIFDKSLFGGEGDRVEGGGRIVRGPIDIVVLEGWCVGFQPISTEEIERRWEEPVRGLDRDFFRSRGFRKEDVIDINERLKGYVHWWSFFDAFIQIKPEEAYPYVHIYKWRLEQEHKMKASNGGRGMSDEQVESFIDRYIPGYVFFGDGISGGGSQRPPWIGHGLCLQIDEHRDLVDAFGSAQIHL